MESKLKSAERLEILINAMIMNHFTEIEFKDDDKRTDAYDSLLFKTFEDGEFDDIFLSDDLEGLDHEERQRILNLSRKYNSLCFYKGSFDNWINSIEGVGSDDPKMVAEILLRDYAYLIRLAKNGGEEVLRFLNKFKSNELFDNGAVIALLVNRFWGDLDTLETVLIDISKEDGKYKDFTDTQKIIMCDSPDGVLIRKQDDGSIDFIDSGSLKRQISNELIGEDNYPMKDINSSEFMEIIRRINSECLKGIVYKK